MSHSIKFVPFFLFFCLSCSKLIGPYRDIEISFENVDYAMVYIHTLPDSNQFYHTQFDREHQQSVHIAGVENGRYWIRCGATKNNRWVTVDTVINYTGRFAWGVEL
jgi:protease II